MMKLPIDAVIPELLSSLESSQNLVLQAAPGAGKTTRVPPALLRANFAQQWGEILVLEPRRLAAKMAARRVASERGEQVGETIGYQFRFENVTSSRTRVRFLTEGMLMRRLLSDSKLGGVAAVVLDEFHERHLHGDVALAFLRRLQLGERPDLRLLVMSATLDTKSISTFLGDCRTFQVEGRMFPVEVEYLAKSADRYLDSLVKEAVLGVVGGGRAEGDVLVFLPGMAEIRRAADALAPLAATHDLLVLPLHGELSREEQDRAVSRAPGGRTKVILSTNVAETSLTIEGVTTVIDSGLARVASYSYWSGLPALRTRPISRASAIQRAGRAGRTAPGRCLRLYSKAEFDGRAQFDVPEIARADLSQTVLEVKALGIPDVAGFPWFDAPPAGALEAASKLLFRLGALDASGAITELGLKMVELPAHPRLARLVLEAERRRVPAGGALLAAMLSESRFTSADLMAEFQRVRVDDAMAKVRDRLWRKGGAPELRGDEADAPLRASLLAGFPDRVARKRVLGAGVARGAAPKASTTELVFAAGGSAWLEDAALAATSEYFVAIDVEERKGLGQARSRLLIRAVCGIEPEWLFDLEPAGVIEKEELSFDERLGRVESVSRILFDQLVVDETRGKPRDPVAAGKLLADQVLKRGLSSVCAEEALSSFGALRARLAALREFFPELVMPALGDDEVRAVLAELCQGKVTLGEVRDADPISWIFARLEPAQRSKLDSLAPEQVVLARGRRAKVHYEPGKPPWVASRLQDFFGMLQGPSVLGGRVPLTLHLLAPNMRAVQVTSDLSGFWARVYPELRRELGRRYPRHPWPVDPIQGI